MSSDGKHGIEASAAPSSDVTVGKYEKCESIGIRKPGLSGRPLQDWIFGEYCLNPRNLLHSTYYLPDGTTRRLQRHRLNKRIQNDTVQKYTNMVMSTGVLSGLRGQIWAIADDAVQTDSRVIT